MTNFFKYFLFSHLHCNFIVLFIFRNCFSQMINLLLNRKSDGQGGLMYVSAGCKELGTWLSDWTESTEEKKSPFFYSHLYIDCPQDMLQLVKWLHLISWALILICLFTIFFLTETSPWDMKTCHQSFWTVKGYSSHNCWTFYLFIQSFLYFCKESTICHKIYLSFLTFLEPSLLMTSAWSVTGEWSC